MANDSALFRTREQLEKEKYYPIDLGHMRRGSEDFLPLYEGKMVQAYDHRAADIVLADENLFRPGQQDQVPAAEHEKPERYPKPRYFVNRNELNWPAGLHWSVAFKDISSVTNSRTMIAAVIPYCAAGHTLPVLFPWSERGQAPAPSEIEVYKGAAPMITASANSFVFDFLLRQRVHTNHLTWFTLEQVPVVPLADFARRFGAKTAAEIVKEHVLHLTYTAHDMKPFAEDMGYAGPPFRWDEEDRRRRRAILDALFFHLYGLGEDDAAYILDTFPIVREQDEAAFGRFRTKEMVLAYMKALAAGDPDARIAA